MGGLVVRIAGTSSVVQERCLIGTGQDCDLVLQDEYASRWHALLIADGDGWRVEDMGSLAGVRVNGVIRASAPLAPGDRIRLGDSELTVVPL